MDTFRITGPAQLSGTVQCRGAKNAAFPLLAATLLTGEPCTLRNMPRIEDVFRMCELLESLGASVEWVDERTVRVQAKEVVPSQAQKEIVERFRGSILLYGSLLARTGRVRLPQPGGCVIGARPIDTHLDALRQLGAHISGNRRDIIVERRETNDTDDTEVVMREISPTATCNALLSAATRPGRTTIRIADADYQVQELLSVLSQMGVTVHDIGHHTITIEGVGEMSGFDHTVIPDPLEAGTFVCAAAATNSALTVERAAVEYMPMFLKKMSDAGVPLEIDKANRRIEVGTWDALSFDILQGLPFPGLHSDLLSAMAVVAIHAEGSTLVQDPIYEGRFKYLEELRRMGADIFIADPHRVIVYGPTALYGKKLGSLDLRGGAALIIAALSAEGVSTVSNVYQIDRGYENIEERLRALGADIERV